MNIIWKLCGKSGDITVSEAMEEVKKKITWHLSTLKTLMDRLVEKEFLSSRIRGRVCFYKPIVDKKDVIKTSLSEILDPVLDGTFGPLVNYLAERKKLNKEQIKQIESIINES